MPHRVVVMLVVVNINSYTTTCGAMQQNVARTFSTVQTLLQHVPQSAFADQIHRRERHQRSDI